MLGVSRSGLGTAFIHDQFQLMDSAIKPLVVWLLKDGETNPLVSKSRPMRTGLLADELWRRGHTVTWWSSTFSHQHKTLIADQDTVTEVKPGYNLHLIHAGSYERNISFARYRHHRVTGRRFRRQASKLPVPDVIVTAFPTIDLAYESVRYANAHRLPVIVDVRDMWPDLWIQKTPPMFRTLVRPLLANEFRRARYVFRGADSMISTSKGFLERASKQGGRGKRSSDDVFYLSQLAPQGHDHLKSERISLFRECAADKVVFIFLGSFGYSVELELICEVAGRFNGDKHVLFALAGDGYQREIVARTEAELTNLIYLGWLNDDEVGDMMQLANVGLAPCKSDYDTVPNKISEYLSAGLPVISSLEGEVEKILSLNEVGLSYRCGDADTLEQHIRTLSTNHVLREKFAMNSTELFKREFCASSVYSAYADHVERVARQSPISDSLRGSSGE